MLFWYEFALCPGNLRVHALFLLRSVSGGHPLRGGGEERLGAKDEGGARRAKRKGAANSTATHFARCFRLVVANAILTS